MKRGRPGDHSCERIVVKEAGHSGHICSELRRQLFASKRASPPTKVVVQRKRLDALLVGTLHDILASQDTWELVQLHASSKSSLRLLEVLSRRGKVDSLVVQDPSERVLEFLAGWMGNHQLKYATVKDIAIRCTTISNAMALTLGEGLSSEVCTVKRLEISEVSFQDLAAVQAMAQGVRQHCGLEKVSFRSCHLEDAEVGVLVQALEHHPNLVELCLSMNYCQEEGTLALARLLTSPSVSLQILDLSYQDTWDDRSYFVHYANALSDPNCRLKELNMSSNFVEDEQFIGLIRALRRSNTCLESLNFRDNRITDVGMEVLVGSLPELTSLKYLNLSHNEYGKTSVEDLEVALSVQPTLVDLCIDHEKYVPKIWYYLALNRSGRYCKSAPRVPLGLWPLILEHCQHYVLTAKDHSLNMAEADIIFDLAHGPALLER